MTHRFTGIRSVIFDLDGTLVDSAPDLVGALDTLLREFDRQPVGIAEGRTMIGDGAARLVERGFIARGGLPATLPMLTQRFVAIYESRLTELTRPFPGVVDMLGVLRGRGLKLAVCTNKPDRATHTLLETLGLAVNFSFVIGGDGVRKPSREPVDRTLAGLGAHANETLFVGDSPIDLAAARAAGLPVVLVSFGYTATPAHALGADAVIDHFDALAPLIA